MKSKVMLATIYNSYYEYCLKRWLDYASTEHDESGADALIVLDNVSEELYNDFVDLHNENKWISVGDVGVIPNPDPTRPNFDAIVASRNFSFDYVKYLYDKLLFVDVDTIPVKPAVEDMCVYFESKRYNLDGKVAMVGGNYHYKNSMLDANKSNAVVPVGDFPVKTNQNLGRQIARKGYTDKVRGLGFGFTMLDKLVFTNPKYRLDTDFLKPDSKFGTEDYPICARVRADGYRLIWAQNIRANHLFFNKKLNRLERW